MIRRATLIAAAMSVAACVAPAPLTCHVDAWSEVACDQEDIDRIVDYCASRPSADKSVTFVRPDVCDTYPFGAEYAGALRCGDVTVEAWCE